MSPYFQKACNIFSSVWGVLDDRSRQGADIGDGYLTPFGRYILLAGFIRTASSSFISISMKKAIN